MRTAYRQKSKRMVQPKAAPKNMQLVVIDPKPGEDPNIFAADVNHPDAINKLATGYFRLFDPAKDDRGPEVKIIATYVGKESSWFPKTSGSYALEFTEAFKDAPADIKRWTLGFGSRSAPQSSRAKIARAWNEYHKNPQWAPLLPYLRIVKIAAIFTTDHPDAPGGSYVVIDPATLPTPHAGEIDRTYM